MKPSNLFAATLFLSVFVHHATLAQASDTHACPVISITGPESSTDNRQKYRVNIEGGDQSVTPAFKWTSSAGKITDGQGTRAMLLDTQGANYMTVTVEVGGYLASCKTIASSSWIVERVASRKVDEYGNLSFPDERARLDQFAEELQNEPTAQGYILVYAGRHSPRVEPKRAGERARNYLVRERGITASRIVAVDGGRKQERMVELFIVPAGAAPPTASPTGKSKEMNVPGTKRRDHRVRL